MPSMGGVEGLKYPREGEPISAAQQRLIIDLLRRKVRGPNVVELSDGWLIKTMKQKPSTLIRQAQLAGYADHNYVLPGGGINQVERDHFWGWLLGNMHERMEQIEVFCYKFPIADDHIDLYSPHPLVDPLDDFEIETIVPVMQVFKQIEFDEVPGIDEDLWAFRWYCVFPFQLTANRTECPDGPLP